MSMLDILTGKCDLDKDNDKSYDENDSGSVHSAMFYTDIEEY